ncbi:MAG: ATPase, T2SS/T4P/T4SS family, partial [Acidimicrobiales bacterium]
MAFKKKSKDDDVVAPQPLSGAGGGVTTVVEARDATHAASTPAPSSGSGGSTPTSNGSAPPKQNLRLGEQLVASNLITEAQLQKALEMQRDSGGLLGEVLISTGALTEQALAHALASYFGFDVANLRRDNVDPSMISYLSEEVARQYVAFPVRMEDDGLYIAVAEPSEDLRNALSKASGKPVKLLIAPLSDVRWAIDSNYRALGSVAQLVQVFESVEGSRKRNVDNAEPEIVADDAPVVQVVDRILTQAMRDRASDVHIEPADDIVRVRFRIDGALKEILSLPAAIGPGLVSRIKIMANMNIVERRRPQDGQLTISIDGTEVDVRVATAAT